MAGQPGKRSSGRGGARPGAGRPRRPGADDAILRATTALLHRVGFRRLTVEAVAEQAGVSVGSVYRRWPTKSSLVAAAYRDAIGPVEPVDTGSLLGDLSEIVEETYQFFTGAHGNLLAALLGASGTDPGLLAAVRDSAEPRRAGMRAIIRRAIAREELPADIDVELAIDLILGPLWTRLLVTGRKITRPVVRRIVALTVDALTGGTSRPGSAER